MSWDAKYILLLLFTTAVSFFSALLMEKYDQKNRKRILLVASLVAGLGILGFFKYFNFFSNNITDLFNSFAIRISPLTLALILPVGISFYTFQTIGYIIDVYKGNIKAEHHAGKYALFVSFFPQIMSGPIGRAGSLIPQISEERHFDYEKATYGLKLMAWGFFKKLIVADTLGTYVNLVFNNPGNYQGISLLVVAVFYSLQIYCDFSGYTDIAIGTAKLFGIDLMTNFRSTYFSASIREFWRRWHISLSTWFRDYVYIPLGGNRVGKLRRNFNVMITFLICGLWHGANWTFVVWGGIHGAGQVVENLLGKDEKNFEGKKTIKWAVSVCLVFAFCTLAWIFFRAQSLSEAFYFFRNMFIGIASPVAYLKAGFLDLDISLLTLFKLIVFVLPVLIFDYISLKKDVFVSIKSLPVVPRWSIYAVLVIFVALFSDKGVSSAFVYFRF